MCIRVGGVLAKLEAEGEGDLARGWPREPHLLNMCKNTILHMFIWVTYMYIYYYTYNICLCGLLYCIYDI